MSKNEHLKATIEWEGKRAEFEGSFEEVWKGLSKFLSEKGDHATKDVPSLEDGKLSLYILYILIEILFGQVAKENLKNLTETVSSYAEIDVVSKNRSPS